MYGKHRNLILKILTWALGLAVALSMIFSYFAILV
jgi:hypothetical protein